MCRCINVLIPPIDLIGEQVCRSAEQAKSGCLNALCGPRICHLESASTSAHPLLYSATVRAAAPARAGVLGARECRRTAQA